MPTFRLFRASGDLGAISLPPLGQVAIETASEPVSELQDCSFEVTDPEPGVRYSIRIGDLLADPGDGDTPAETPGEGRRFRNSIEWPSGFYFESARGEIVVRIMSAAETGSWQLRAELRLFVSPDKLGEERYEAMYESLSQLACGFVFDLVSKSTRRLDLEIGHGGIAAGSAQVRLRFLESVWRRVSVLLRSIQKEPLTALRRSRRHRPVWGVESLRPRTLTELASRGLSRSSISLPVRVVREILEETFDTPEHRMVARFLQAIAMRISDCRMDAEVTLRAIESDQPQLGRSGTATGSRDLLARRRDRLLSAVSTAEDLEADVRKTLQSAFLRGISPETTLRRTPAFDNVLQYRRLWESMLSFYRHAAVVLDAGAEERIKSTWRMYEQWCFFQIAAALKASGLRCEEDFGVLHRRSRYRYTLDLDHGSRLSFIAADGTPVLLAYQPLLFTYTVAQARRESMFRGRTGEAPWTPDIVMEILDRRPAPGEVPNVRRAIIIDAKYSRRVEERHWNAVTKYAEIRSTATNLQTARQIWVAYPGTDSIRIRDDFVHWTENGPSAAESDFVFGVLPLLPPTDPDQGSVSTPAALEFVRGMLRHAGIALTEARVANAS